MFDPLPFEEFGSLDWTTLEVEPNGESERLCDCCGATTKKITGFVHKKSAETVSGYWVTWTPGKPDHSPWFDIFVGPWGRDDSCHHRCLISLDYVLAAEKSGFMIVDPRLGAGDNGSLFQHALSRSNVIETPLASQLFAIIDAVFEKEPRLSEIRRWTQG